MIMNVMQWTMYSFTTEYIYQKNSRNDKNMNTVSPEILNALFGVYTVMYMYTWENSNLHDNYIVKRVYDVLA